jgi:phospholipase/carboxylesterase
VKRLSNMKARLVREQLGAHLGRDREPRGLSRAKRRFGPSGRAASEGRLPCRKKGESADKLRKIVKFQPPGRTGAGRSIGLPDNGGKADSAANEKLQVLSIKQIAFIRVGLRGDRDKGSCDVFQRPSPIFLKFLAELSELAKPEAACYRSRMRHPSTVEQENIVGLPFLYRAGRDRSAPLAVLLHGRAGTREVIWMFERHVPPHAAVLSLQAPLAEPAPLGGFSWWRLDADEEERAEALRHAVERMTEAIERFIESHALQPMSRVALGFSQGAALISAALLSQRLRVDGAALLAGFVLEPPGPPAVHGAPKVFVAHGTRDEVISIERARRGAKLLESLGLPVTHIEDDVGHKIGVQGTRALKTWLHDLLGET